MADSTTTPPNNSTSTVTQDGSYTAVVGSSGSDTQHAPTGTGADVKFDPKAGNDVVIGSTGDDIIIGGPGSDYLFGGLGADQFQFSKYANAGDHDYIVDFNLQLGDSLKIFNGATISNATYSHDSAQELNGHNLTNDANVYDVTLTLHVADGAKSFDYQVTLLDVVKNTGWSADQFDAYLHSIGMSNDVHLTHVPDAMTA